MKKQYRGYQHAVDVLKTLPETADKPKP